MKIGDEVYIHGFVDEIRKDTVIIRNKGGYFGTDAEEVAPTVERKRGKWVHSEDEAWSGGGKTTCSACDWSYSDGAYHDVYEFNFCPNCGAEMKRR